MRRLRISVDYTAFPVWDLDDGGMVDPATLPIDAVLVARLQAWADRFDATLNRADPPASGFSSPAEEAAFTGEGRQLAHELQARLGAGYEVRYGDEPVA